MSPPSASADPFIIDLPKAAPRPLLASERFSLEVLQRDPTSVPRPKSLAELRFAIQRYFGAIADAESRPTITGLALGLGLTSVTEMERWGRRNPSYRDLIGKAMLAVSMRYEELLSLGGSPAGAIFGLKNIPDGFDMDEPSGTSSPRYWNDKKELEVSGNIAGVITHEHMGRELSPEEAYAKVIEGRPIPEQYALSPPEVKEDDGKIPPELRARIEAKMRAEHDQMQRGFQEKRDIVAEFTRPSKMRRREDTEEKLVEISDD